MCTQLILTNQSKFTKRIAVMSEEISNKKKVALTARAIDKMKAGKVDKINLGNDSNRVSWIAKEIRDWIQLKIEP